MALDFPANPIDGQEYESYVFYASSGVWKSREESASPAVVSSTAPATANSGDIWVDSSDGIAYVRYDDGTSSQWIELISSGVTALTLKADKTYVDSQDLLKANLSGASFTGDLTTSGKVVSTTPVDSGSTGGLIIKAPASGSQTSGFLQFVNSAHNAQWASIEATPSSELKLNATYVKMPSQPTFFAWQQEGVGTYFTTSVTNPIFTSTIVNTGNNYSTSTGRFTAPVAGTYEFNCMLLVRSSSAAAEMTFRKNGSNVVGRNLAYSNPSGTGGHDPSHYSIYIQLAANDYVTPWISVNGGSGTDIYYGGGLGWFSGRLVG